VMHDGMPYGRIQGQGHSREVDRQSPTGLIFINSDSDAVSWIGLVRFWCWLIQTDLDISAQVPKKGQYKKKSHEKDNENGNLSQYIHQESLPTELPRFHVL